MISPTKSKRVGQFNLEGKLLQEFSSISELIRVCGEGADKALKRKNNVYKEHVYKLMS